MMGPILVAGEDHGKRVELSSLLRVLGYRVIEAENGLRTLELLRRRRNIALALIDIRMSDLGGSEIVTNMRIAGVATPAVVICEQEDEELLQKAMKAGAADYLIYPISSLRLGVTLSNLSLVQTMQREIHYIRRNNEDHLRFSDLFIKSEAMKSTLTQSQLAANSSDNLLIEGELGTGRETLARIIHHESNYSEGAFIRAECFEVSSIQEEELMWKEKFLPLVEAGKGGTICLCEIDRLTAIQQKRLVKFLKERSSNSKRPDFRLMVIALPNLVDLVSDGDLNAELYDLLTQLRVDVPPLRERRDDLPEIAHRAVDHILVQSGQVRVHGIAGAAIALLVQYDWPGNVSELENMLFRAILLSNGPLLMVQDFPQLTGKQFVDLHSVVRTDLEATYEKLSVPFVDADGHVRAFNDIEREVIEKAIEHYNGRMSEVARRLRIGRSTLYRKIDEYNDRTEHVAAGRLYG